MSSQYLSFVLPPALLLAAGAVALWLGFRAPRLAAEGTPRGPRDRLTLNRGGLFRAAGPLLVIGALLWFVKVPVPDNWVRHTTADGVCSIEFPEPPEHEVNADGDDADRLQVAQKISNAHFSLSFSDLPEAVAALPVEQQFERLRASFGSKRTSSGAEPKLVAERAFVDGGFPGREFSFVVGDQFATRIKVLLYGARVYRAIAVTPPGGRADRDAQKFIGSFRVERAHP